MMIDKIKKIVETIKAECPHGCSGVSCSECPLNNPESEFGYEVCEMLAKIELLLEHEVRRQNLSARSRKHNVPGPSPRRTSARYSDVMEQEPEPMESSIIHVLQMAQDKLKKENEK
ncbi:MAG: hypothetical protein JXA98_04410 [Methanosarcinaceae archaeon]|nr:hypothetical protein [Methanosarcinaceae archaeon]